MKRILFSAAALAALFSLVQPTSAQHAYGGLIDTDGTAGLGAGDRLAFVNQTTGTAITGASYGTQSMVMASIGAMSGLYFNDGISFTGLSNGRNWRGSAYRPANAFAATTGSLLQLHIASITGPTGATFGYWDEAINPTAPAVSYTIGSSGPMLVWNLTDTSLVVGDGTNPPTSTALNNPPVDPYGHIHGRSFTVDTPGEYTVSYILRDASGNHVDSDPFVVTYSAVPEPGLFALIGAGLLGLHLINRRRRS